ncbi:MULTISPECIES: T9SS type A sorting domain-containing protein [unclassified Paraflavitalea]|uniref:T9SS type A sorting domain-containing protein n=1 Tax=unclassified Paraflavitalea TaxID=2798305 RepID=UPI003D324C8B
MKLILSRTQIALLVLFTSLTANVFGQACLSSTTIYGLNSSGNVRTIDITTGAVGSSNLNSSSVGASASNGLGYNNFNGRFYYFRRNPNGSGSAFVSFSPIVLLNSETTHATFPTSDRILTGCISFNGLGYYCITTTGVLYYYNISANTWTAITSSFRLSNGTDITSTLTSLSGGDIAIDGYGKLWIVASSSSNYCLYKVTSSLPTSAVASLTVQQIIAPTTTTPSGSAFAGISFNQTGQILLGTLTDNRIYRLENNLTMTLVATMSSPGYGNDFTSCAFPLSVLPIIWKSFTVTTNNNTASLNWVIDAQSNEKEFYVQSSTDGTNWVEMGKVVAKAKTGNDLTYNFTTGSIVNGNNYFRVRQVDMDNNVSYSEIKVVNVTKAAKINFWPNPAQEFINLQHTKQITTATKAQIFDQAGRLVKEATILAGTTQVNISNLVSGSYYIRVQFADGEVFKQLFVKQ